MVCSLDISITVSSFYKIYAGMYSRMWSYAEMYSGMWSKAYAEMYSGMLSKPYAIMNSGMHDGLTGCQWICLEQ